jgi:arabinogalactan oligomer / maltooligosaccharide transport system permease protein
MEKSRLNLLGKIIASIVTGGFFYLFWLKAILVRGTFLISEKTVVQRRNIAKWKFILALFVPLYVPIWYYTYDQQLQAKMQQHGLKKKNKGILNFALTSVFYLAFVLVFLLVEPLNFALLGVAFALHLGGLMTAASLLELDYEQAYEVVLPKLERGIFLREDNPTFFLRRLTVKKVILGTLAYAWLILMCVIVLTPVMWMLSASFTNGTQLAQVPIIPVFSQWTLKNYIDLFTYTSTTAAGAIPDYVKAFLTTLTIASLNMVLVVVFSSLVGFSFSRYKFKGKKKVLLTMMGLQMFPSFMGMLALFMFFRQFSLLNNPIALTLVYTAGSIPYNTFVVRGFMRNIPKSLDEAAFIDGASNLQTLFLIIIPLAVPIMGFIAVNAFMGPWLDYILPSVIMPSRDTVAVWLFRYMDPLSSTYSPIKFMTGALVIAFPIMIVQAFMQRYLVYGLTSGAEKG